MTAINEKMQVEEARRRFYALESAVLSELSDTYESALKINWPDLELGGGVIDADRGIIEAIRENLPFQKAQWPAYDDLDELFALQHHSRLLVQYNEFAGGAVRNRKNFIVGYGCQVSVAPKTEGVTLTAEEKQQCKEVIKAFEKRNKWRRRSRANQLRLDRDGEVFLRKFRTKDGLVLRYVEPEDVQPPDERKEDHPLGVITDPRDVETVIGYYVRSGEAIEEVPAEQIQHRKLDDDMGSVRGVPLFVNVKRSLANGAKIQRNVSALTAIQSRYGLLRKHAQNTMAQIQQAVARNADVEVKHPITGNTEYGQENRPGTVVDVPPNVTYEFPSQHADPEKFLGAKDSNLRAAAAGLAMPEYMFTADASNANYASTMQATGPATREFESAQWDAVDYDVELFEEEFDLAVVNAMISQELREKILIKIDPPSPAVRNELEQATVREKDRALGVSAKTLIEESGRDYEVEKQNNDDFQEEYGEVPGASLAVGKGLAGAGASGGAGSRTGADAGK